MFRDSVTNLTAAGLIVAVRCCNFSSDISLSLLNWLMSGQMSTSDGFSRLHTAQKWVAAAHSLQRLSSIRIDSRLMCSWYCHVHMCPKSLQILIYSLKHRKNLLQIFVCVCVFMWFWFCMLMLCTCANQTFKSEWIFGRKSSDRVNCLQLYFFGYTIWMYFSELTRSTLKMVVCIDRIIHNTIRW